MKIDLPATLGDTWALFKADRDLLLRVAGVFLFLPALALALLVPAYPLPAVGDGDRRVQAQAWSDAFTVWANQYGLVTIIGYAILVVGVLVILALYLDSERPTVSRAMVRAVSLLPRYMLALLLVGLPAQLGLALFLLPGLYVLGRVVLTGPILASHRPISAWQAIIASIRHTSGAGLPLMALMGFGYLGGQMAQLLTRLAQEPSVATNPVAFAALCVLASGVAAAAQLSLTLIAVVVYRRAAAR